MTWIQAIKDDLPWLYRQLCGYASMPDPAEDVDAWHLLIQEQYIRWHQKSDSTRHMTETCPYTRSTVPPKSFAPHASPCCPDPGSGRHRRSSASVALIACLWSSSRISSSRACCTSSISESCTACKASCSLAVLRISAAIQSLVYCTLVKWRSCSVIVQTHLLGSHSRSVGCQFPTNRGTSMLVTSLLPYPNCCSTQSCRLETCTVLEVTLWREL